MKGKSKPKMIVIISLCAVVLLGIIGASIHFLTALPDIEPKRLKDDYNKKYPDTISISEFKYKDEEVTDSDINKLKKIFYEKVPAKKIAIKGKFRTAEYEIDGEYNMLYVYANEKYKLIEIDDRNIANRKITPIAGVSSNTIMKTLRDQKIGDFKKGYVGREKSTTINVIERKSNLNNNKDKVKIEAKVKNDFAVTSIIIDMEYEFKKDHWQLMKIVPEDKEDYKVKFIDDNIPKEPKEEEITTLLTDPKNQKTYMTNKGYTKKVYVSKPKARATADSMAYEYLFVVTYDKVGDIEYKVKVPYEYNGGEWIKKDVSIEFNKALLEPMKAEWKSDKDKDGKDDHRSINITKVDNDNLEGTYTKAGKTENIKGKLNVPIKDDNWEITISSAGIEDGKESIVDINSASLNLKDKTIAVDGHIFKH